MNDNDALAFNLRQRRAEAGMSIAALANRSGVAAGTVSMIETGRGNPTLETVRQLAAVFGLPVVDLLNTPRHPMELCVRAHSGTKETIGRLPATLLHRYAPTGPVEIFDVDIPEGARRSSPPHSEGVYEHIWLATGRAQVGPIGAPTVMGPGDYLCFAAWVQHMYLALDGPARACMILSYAKQPLQVETLRHLHLDQ